MGNDEHSVGMREIIDIKHGGIEKYGIVCVYLGTSVPVEKLLDAAIEHAADVVLLSTVITHGEVHRQNMEKIADLAAEKGVRDKLLLISGGTQVTDEPRQELGHGRWLRPRHQGSPGGELHGRGAARAARRGRGRGGHVNQSGAVEQMVEGAARGEPRAAGGDRAATVVDALVAEIGSTTTVVSAFDGLREVEPRRHASWGKASRRPVARRRRRNPGRVARARLETVTGPLQPRALLATSSAAGGLRMTVHGLTAKMTARAAREAALGAGGVVEYQTAGKLRRHDLRRIEEARPSLIMLAGGVEGGDVETVLQCSAHGALAPADRGLRR